MATRAGVESAGRILVRFTPDSRSPRHDLRGARSGRSGRGGAGSRTRRAPRSPRDCPCAPPDELPDRLGCPAALYTELMPRAARAGTRARSPDRAGDGSSGWKPPTRAAATEVARRARALISRRGPAQSARPLCKMCVCRLHVVVLGGLPSACDGVTRTVTAAGGLQETAARLEPIVPHEGIIVVAPAEHADSRLSLTSSSRMIRRHRTNARNEAIPLLVICP